MIINQEKDDYHSDRGRTLPEMAATAIRNGRGWGDGADPATFQPTQSSPIWLKVFGVNLVPISADCAGFTGYTGS
jgi:hypothetical protein